MLVLEAPSGESARRFLRGEGTAQASPVLERWSRAASLGVRVDSDAYPEGTTDSDLSTRRERLADVFREKRALLKPLGEQLAERSLVAVVADPDGVLLALHGAGSIADPLMRVRLVEGARWSEDVRGTNAIGTALVERQPVAVIGAAHFERRNHAIFCYGHPIFDGYGDLVAVLDVSGPLEGHDRAVGGAVRAAAVSLEQALRRLAYAQSGAGTLSAIERLVHRSSSATMLVEASGQVAIMNDRAADALGLRERGSVTCDRIFGLPFEGLQRLVVDGSPEMKFETETADYRVELDPLNGAGGRTFALVIHLEPSRARNARPQIRSVQPPRDVAAKAHPAFAAILGSDMRLIDAKSAATRFAGTNLPVLLLAETGTGKELFARAIHGASGRAGGPFVALNCGALASGLLESELFGHAPNAFTGASRSGADGKVMAADGGTLFLDEIAEMPDAVQAALLRVLDEGGAHYRVGDTHVRLSDFHLVCATCRDLPAMVEEGSFRRDLFFRIHGACVRLPALRERTDRVALGEGLLAQISAQHALSSSATDWILQHGWPGNVRELKSALIHAVAMADDMRISAEHFPRALVGLSPTPAPASTSDTRTRVEIVSDAIVDAVRASGGNVSAAARRLGIARSTVYRVLSQSRRGAERSSLK